MEKTYNIHKLLNRFNSILGEQPEKTFISSVGDGIRIQMVYATNAAIPAADIWDPFGDRPKQDIDYGNLIAMCHVLAKKDDLPVRFQQTRLYLDRQSIYTNSYLCNSNSFANRIYTAWDQLKDEIKIFQYPEVELGRKLTMQAQKKTAKELRHQTAMLDELVKKLETAGTADVSKKDFLERINDIAELKDTAEYLLYHTRWDAARELK